MHELSLALEVCRIAEASAAPHPARAVRAVAVEVGEDAGIELENFRFCLEALLSEDGGEPRLRIWLFDKDKALPRLRDLPPLFA